MLYCVGIHFEDKRTSITQFLLAI